jgi:hypothetical protein
LKEKKERKKEKKKKKEEESTTISLDRYKEHDDSVITPRKAGNRCNKADKIPRASAENPSIPSSNPKPCSFQLRAAQQQNTHHGPGISITQFNEALQFAKVAAMTNGEVTGLPVMQHVVATTRATQVCFISTPHLAFLGPVAIPAWKQWPALRR